MDERERQEMQRRQKRGIEITVLLFNSIYAIVMSIQLLGNEGNIGGGICIWLLMTGCWIVILGGFKDFDFRSKFVTAAAQFCFFVYALCVDDLTGMFAFYTVMIVSIGLYGEPELMFITLLSSTAINVYYFIVQKGIIVLGDGKIDVFSYLQIANIYAVQYILYTWLKNRKEASGRIMQMVQLLKATEKSKDEFLANVSHEVRTPINTICGVSEILLAKELEPAIQTDIVNIQTAGKNLMSVVNDILDFSELQAGKISLEEEEYCIKDTIYEVIEVAKARQRNNRLEFIVDCDMNIPEKLYGDEKKIRRAIINLIDNALKFTSEGYVSLGIYVRKETYGVNLTISISDTGIGINDASLERIFSTFTQVDQKATRQEGGIGLGLSISQKLIQSMGGVMTVKSQPDKGSCFKFVVPQKIIDETPVYKVDKPQEHRVAIYINMEQFGMAAVRDEYRNVIGRMIVQSKVNCHACRNLAELKRRVTFEEYTHIIISCYEYLEDKAFFDEISEKFNIIAIMFKDEKDKVENSRIKKLYKPFYSGVFIDAMNGIFREDVEKSSKAARFIAPNARILVVDDNAMNIRVIKGLLEEYRIKITSALSGNEALEKITSCDYDFVFMDHMMPGMDGVETFHHIREKNGNYYKQVPIIALTANAVAGAREMFLNEGFTDFIEKPVEKAVLERALKRNLMSNKIVEVSEEEQAEEIQEETAVPAVAEEPSQGNIPKEETKEEVLIDLKKGDSYCGGRKNLLEILKEYTERGRDDYEDMEQKFIDGNIKDFTIAVHALKGFMASIGADNLSALARDLEMAGKRNDEEHIRANKDHLKAEFNKVYAHIHKILGIEEQPYEDNATEAIPVTAVAEKTVETANNGTSRDEKAYESVNSSPDGATKAAGSINSDEKTYETVNDGMSSKKAYETVNSSMNVVGKAYEAVDNITKTDEAQTGADSTGKSAKTLNMEGRTIENASAAIDVKSRESANGNLNNGSPAIKANEAEKPQEPEKPPIEKARFESLCNEFEDAVYSLDGEKLTEIAAILSGYSYPDKAITKKISSVKRKVKLSDYMAALDVLCELKEVL